MALGSKGESSKQPSRRTDYAETAFNATGVGLDLVRKVAMIAPSEGLKQAATIAIIIFDTVQAVKDNKDGFKRLGYDSVGLIEVIWEAYQDPESREKCLSPEMLRVVAELAETLDEIRVFIEEKLKRGRIMRVIHSKADPAKIAEFRERLNYAMQKFEVRSFVNIDVKLGNIQRTLEGTVHKEAERTNEEEKKPIPKIKQVEIDRQARQQRSDALVEIETDSKARGSEPGRLRKTARTVEIANRFNLKKEHEDEPSEELEDEEEIAELRRKKAADSRRSSPTHAQSTKNKKSPRRKDEVEAEENWERKDRETRRPAKRSPKATRKQHRVEDTTDDEEMGEETMDEDEDRAFPPQRTSRKANRRRQTSTPEMDDLMARLQSLGTPIQFQYGNPYPIPMGSHGYMPGTVINSGIGNITNSNISNVGNNNSVTKVYKTRRTRDY